MQRRTCEQATETLRKVLQGVRLRYGGAVISPRRENPGVDTVFLGVLKEDDSENCGQG